LFKATNKERVIDLGPDENEIGTQMVVDNQKFFDTHLRLTHLTNVKANEMADKSKDLGIHSEFDEETDLKKFSIFSSVS
jgi:hypothetical protein